MEQTQLMVGILCFIQAQADFSKKKREIILTYAHPLIRASFTELFKCKLLKWHGNHNVIILTFFYNGAMCILSK